MFPLYILRNKKTNFIYSGDRGHVHLYRSFDDAQHHLDWGGNRLPALTPKEDWEICPCHLFTEDKQEIPGPFMF